MIFLFNRVILRFYVSFRGSIRIFPDLGHFFLWNADTNNFHVSPLYRFFFMSNVPAVLGWTTLPGPVVAAFISRFTGAFVGSHSAFACDGDFATFGTLRWKCFTVDRLIGMIDIDENPRSHWRPFAWPGCKWAQNVKLYSYPWVDRISNWSISRKHSI